MTTTIFPKTISAVAAFRTTTDASSIYRQRAGVEVARANSSSDTGNLAAVTKNSTFPSGALQVPFLQQRRQS